MLSNKVNSRDPVIVTDAELSIVKVAQLERVFYYKETAPTIQSLLSERSAASRIGPQLCSVGSICWLLLLVWLPCAVLWHWYSDGDGVMFCCCDSFAEEGRRCRKNTDATLDYPKIRDSSKERNPRTLHTSSSLDNKMAS